MMQEELVERRRWLTKEQFLDLIGSANLLPGPSSTELAIYIGFRQAGWKGLFLAGSCFILPAFVIVISIAWAYVRFGHLPQVTGVLYGVKPVVIAIVFQALWNLSL
jgi:chromate transporter